MKNFFAKIIFLALGSIALILFIYESWFSPVAEDRKNAIKLCSEIKVGMPLEQVKVLASQSKRPPDFWTDTAFIGYGSCRCEIHFSDNKVLKAPMEPKCLH